MASRFYDDSYWDRYLPKNYDDVAKAISLTYSSKRELVNRLYWHAMLVEGGTKWVEIYRMKKLSMIVSAKTLDISEGFDSACWQWVRIEGSRFDQAAELKRVHNFEVWQRIDCNILTPDVEYTVSFVLKIDKSSMAECKTPFTFSLKLNDGSFVKSSIYLNDYNKKVNEVANTAVKSDRRGWEEFVVGEFKGGETSAVEVSMENKDASFKKTGIAIDGVKFMPK